MREFKKRRTRKSEALRISIGLAGIVALAIVAYFAVRGTWGMYGKFTEAGAAREVAEAQLIDLQVHKETLEKDVEDLGTLRGQETAVRERYGVVRPGEGVIDIVRQASSSEVSAEGQSVWERLWRLLFVW